MANRFISAFLPRVQPPQTTVDDAIAGMQSGLIPVSHNDLMAQALGVTIQNSELGAASAATAPTAGTMYATAIWMPGGVTINNMLTLVGTAGAGTPPTGIYLGLADWQGHVVASSANVASNPEWTSVGIAQVPLNESPLTISTEEAGLYYALILQVGSWGTTQMQLRRPTSWGGVGTNGVLAYGTAGTGLTGIPADGTPITVTQGGQFWWAGAN